MTCFVAGQWHFVSISHRCPLAFLEPLSLSVYCAISLQIRELPALHRSVQCFFEENLSKSFTRVYSAGWRTYLSFVESYL